MRWPASVLDRSMCEFVGDRDGTLAVEGLDTGDEMGHGKTEGKIHGG